jgi:hypothetical protein
MVDGELHDVRQREYRAVHPGARTDGKPATPPELPPEAKNVLDREFKWNPTKKVFEAVEQDTKPPGGSTQSTRTPDPIDRLVAELSASHLWQNGSLPILDLPETASPEQVIERTLAMITFDKGHVTSYRISKVRQVHIRGSLPDLYTAALVQTNFGEKIVLLKYNVGARSPWWSRVYDAKGN